MKIKNTTKLIDLFQEYPQLKLRVSALLPAYGLLEQPQLKDKVLSMTSIEHLARKADLEVADLISELQQAVGIPSKTEVGQNQTLAFNDSDPAWIQGSPRHKVDGVELLSKGEHPLNLIKSHLEELASGELILLTTNFHPQPMVEAMQEQGAEVFSRNDLAENGLFLTFIRK